VHILFLSHYYPPEVNAPATRTFDHCVRWARAGHDVTVVTCAPNCPDGVLYPGYANRLLPQVEHREGVRVVRVWTYLAANAGTIRRIVNYLTYMVSAVLASLRLARPDVVIATSPQFFCGWAGVFVSRLRRAPLVLEIRDIWPESIRAVGAMRNRRLLRLLEALERRVYRAATHIVTVGEGYRANIVRKTHAPQRITVIMNGIDVRRFVPREPDLQFLQAWGLENKFVCSYVGTIGMAHGLEVVLEAAEILRRQGRDDISFCLVGDGSSRERLQQQAQQAGLNGMVVFTGRQPSEKVPAILASSNACLIHLKECRLFQSVIPSKIFETLAMARPMIMGVRGKAREIALKAGAGLAMEPGSADESLVEAVQALADNPDAIAGKCLAARQYVLKHFSRDVLAARYLRLLERVAGAATVQFPGTIPEGTAGFPRRKAA